MPLTSNNTQKEDSLGFCASVHRSSPDLATLTQRRFRQTAYSLLSATLMGSSLGLVVYQRRTLSLLLHNSNDTNSISISNSGSNIDNNSPLYPTSIGSTIPSTIATEETTTTTFERLGSFWLSTWFPVAVWFVTLMSTSFLVSLQNLVPRSFSPRTGILASHLVFSVVWVILASVQEVHENLSSSSSSSYDGVWNDSVQTNNNNVMGEHLSSASPSSQPQHQQSYTQKYPQSQALGDSNRSAVAGGEGSMMAVSLCVVWYVAVMLLGVATALLATSSTVLDSQMEQQIQEVVAQEEQKEDSDDITVVLVNNNNDEKSTTAAAAAQSVKYPLVQKVTLAMMILVLFYSQMWFFEWILSALSSLTSLSSSGIAVSTRLGLFGLFSTLIMLTLGMRFIPPTKARQ